MTTTTTTKMTMRGVFVEPVVALGSLFAFGYWLGGLRGASNISSSTSSSSSSCSSSTVENSLLYHYDFTIIEWLVESIGIPGYTCVVFLYLTARMYHDAMVTDQLSKKKQRHNNTSGASSKVVQRTPNAPPALVSESQSQSQSQSQPMIDLTGAFQLIENINFEAFLAAQGVPWALRAAANRVFPTHRITHQHHQHQHQHQHQGGKASLLTIKVEGIIESETTYQIGGPPVRGFVRGRLFEDSVIYLIEEQQQQQQHDTSTTYSSDSKTTSTRRMTTGIQTTKRAVDDGYTIRVRRRLSNDRQIIVMTSTVSFDDNSKESISCQQTFQRKKE